MSSVGSSAIDIQELIIELVNLRPFCDMDSTLTLARQVVSPSLNCKGSEQG